MIGSLAPCSASTSGEPRVVESEKSLTGSLADEIVEEIKDALVRGELRPGDHVSADRVARNLGVSHVPVREALSKLEANGHLISVPNRGFIVPELSLHVVDDVYRWREVLEDEAHRIAVPNLADVQLAELANLCREMRDAVSAGDAVRFHRINRRFHFIPFEATNSRVLARVLPSLWDTASHYQSVLIQVQSSIPVLQSQHENLLQAFLDRDPERVNEVMRGHRTVTLAMMRAILSDRVNSS